MLALKYKKKTLNTNNWKCNTVNNAVENKISNHFRALIKNYKKTILLLVDRGHTN
jgi:hypothetical protein